MPRHTRRPAPARPAPSGSPRPRRRHTARTALLLASALVAAGAVAARAQFSALHAGPDAPVSNDEPVYYQADSAEYDRDNGIVTLTGNVEIWQGPRDLRGDKVTYDRNTGVVAASGHVVLLEPDGQVIFGDYAELTRGMKDGIVSNLRSQLADNGHLAANGARRTEAKLNELSRAVYSTCDACKQDPDGPLLWDLRARSAVQDLDNKRIEYTDAVVDIYGVPVLYMPYFSHPDPSQRRASGFLVPLAGNTSYLGFYTELPYFWAINDSTDATIAPLLATKDGPAAVGQFRHRFNDGTVTIDGSAADSNKTAQGDIFVKGQFAIDDEWRWGFDIERASSAIYMRDFRQSGEATVLASSVYLEGFGQGSYARLDSLAYQGLTSNLVPAQVPIVLPRYEYSFVGEPDALGGRTSVDTEEFNLIRDQGTNTDRISLRTRWERPFNGPLGDLWKLVLNVDSAGYSARGINLAPTWGSTNSANTAQAMPTAAVELHWPFERDAGAWGTQVVEPIVQLIAAPNGSSYGASGALAANGQLATQIPNEDSFDYEFTDSTLFNLNRFYGVDRLEGGTRANVGLHTDWYFKDGEQIDALVGQGYRTAPDPAFVQGSGLNGTVTDIVSHVSYTPNSWFDITTRERFDHQTMNVRLADTLATGGPSWLRLSGGYLYSRYSPYNYYSNFVTVNGATSLSNTTDTNTPRSELTLGASTSYGHWRLHASARRNLQSQQMDNIGVGGAYEDECFVFDAEFYHRYTSLNGDHGDSGLLLQITLKTVGSFGYNGL